MTSWTSVSVGVADLDEALNLWSGSFGLEVKAQKDGDDPELALLWGLSPDDIQRQALVGTPGVNTGLMHFVQFKNPGPAVREDAQAFDLCPKNLDIYVRDMPSRVLELKNSGHTFRNDNYSEVTAPDGTIFREIHLPGHDAINIVLLEVIGLELPFTPEGYAGIGPLITIVRDAGADGQMEVINYRGSEGNDLYPRAVPKQRGILQISYESESLTDLAGKLDQAGIEWSDRGKFSILYSSGRTIRFHSPAGLRIEVFQREKSLN